MSPIESLMREWLASGDPAKERHARERIALGFDRPAAPFVPPKVVPLPPWLTCLYAAPARTDGCRSVRCWAYRGSSCGGSHAEPGHCRKCLKSLIAPAVAPPGS